MAVSPGDRIGLLGRMHYLRSRVITEEGIAKYQFMYYYIESSK